jgi:predicted nicotinamide N-methyase
MSEMAVASKARRLAERGGVGESHAAMSARGTPPITSLAIPGGWTEREWTIEGHVFRLVEPIDTSQPHLADPYWAKLWPTATFLAKAVLRRQETGARRQEPDQPTNPKSKIQNPKSCLELGCGSGLVGLAALAAGLDVTFSDYVPQAVELALENSARNGFRHAKGLVLDWRLPPDVQFPFIVAADVTYDRANLGPLLDTVERMLAPGGEAWFSDAGRGPVAEFVKRAGNRGWSVSLWDEQNRRATVPALGHCQRIVLRRAK